MPFYPSWERLGYTKKYRLGHNSEIQPTDQPRVNKLLLNGYRWNH